jgi:hypothetical protein
MHHNGSDRYRNRVSWILRTGIQVLVTLATVGVERAQSLYPQTWGSVPNGMPAGLTCVAIKAGEKHVLALKSDGTVVAWGGENSTGKPTCRLD